MRCERWRSRLIQIEVMQNIQSECYRSHKNPIKILEIMQISWVIIQRKLMRMLETMLKTNQNVADWRPDTKPIAMTKKSLRMLEIT